MVRLFEKVEHKLRSLLAFEKGLQPTKKQSISSEDWSQPIGYHSQENLASHPTKKFKVLFVGAFADGTSKGGGVGGVMKATHELLLSPISEQVEWIKIDTTMISIPPPSFPIRAMYGLKRMMKLLQNLHQEEIDAVLLFSDAGASFVEKGLMAVLSNQVGIPVIFCPQSGFLPVHIENSKAMKSYAKWVFNHCSSVLCQGEGWKQYYQQLSKLPDENFSVIPNWLNTQHYGKQTPKDVVKILYLGWVEDSKGIFELIEAGKRLKNKQLKHHFEFLICGSGSALSDAKSMVEKQGLLDIFHFKGWIKGQEKNRIFQEADVYVHPSHAEGLPNSLLEAMASGLPSVATTVGAIPEVIANQHLGYLVPPKSPTALADALEELIISEEKRKNIGKSAKLHIQENYDTEVIWPKILDLIESIQPV